MPMKGKENIACYPATKERFKKLLPTLAAQEKQHHLTMDQALNVLMNREEQRQKGGKA